MVVTADGVAPPIDRAWGYIPPGRVSQAARGTFTRRRIDRITEISAAGGCFVLGLQAFFIALGNDAGVIAPWNSVLPGVAFGALVVMCIAALFERTAKPAAGAYAVLFIVVLAVWPFVTQHPVLSATPEPWPWYLVNVATMAAVIAFPWSLQLTWTIATPLLYGLIRLVEGRFAGEFWMAVVFEVPYSLILGGVLLTLAVIFRRMASGVDEERARAVSAYANVAEAQAAQVERVTLSALMHDSVLAALISAERADSPRARSLAVSMAREALEGLADTGTPTGGIEARPMSMPGLARSIQSAMGDLGVRLVVDVSEPQSPPIPGAVAVAMIRAATQAAANAVQHADGRGLAAFVRRPEGVPAGIPSVCVVVRDQGPGFDVNAVPDDRLGISASIVARVQAVGGTIDIDSSAHGTTVSLMWTET